MNGALHEANLVAHIVGHNVSGYRTSGSGLGNRLASGFHFLKRTYRTSNLISIRYGETYKTGLQEFDGRRRTILGVYSGFNSELCLIAEDMGSVRRLNERASLLVRLIGELFSFEEAVMGETEYPEAVAHKARHVRFLETLHAEFERIQSGRADMHDLSFLIGSWLAEHMAGMDQELGAFVSRAINEAAQPEEIAA